MKILNICMSAPFTEGYSYQDNLLSEYQHKLGHIVTVVTGLTTRDSNGKKVITSPCDKIMSNGVRLIRISSGNKILQVLGYTPKIGKIIKEVNPDLIFIHGLCNLTPIQAIRYKKKNPDTILVADNHQDRNIFRYDKFPFSQLLKLWRTGWKTWNKHFNHIYGTTSWRKDFAIKHYGIPEDKADVLLMGVDVDNLTPDKEFVRKEIRSSLGINENAFVFIHGGKMDSGKKTIEVIQSFLLTESKDVRLILFGSVGSDIEDKFDKLIHEDNRIVYIGYIDSKQVHKYFFASDFSLFPGQHSVLWEEAIGCELPGMYMAYSEKDHTDICGNSISIKPKAGVDDIAKIMKDVFHDKEYYVWLKRNAQEASKRMSYYDIAKFSVRK